MGNSNGNSGDINDVNFFSTSRNDVPAQPNGLQQEVYRDWQPQAPGRVGPTTDNTASNNGYVTIRDGQNIIYAQPGSTVIINEGQNCGPQRIGGQGYNGFMPNYQDTMRQVQQQRMMQWEMQNHFRQPYYQADNSACFRGNFRNVNGGGWEVPPPFIPQPYGYNRGGAFIGAHIGPISIGFNLGGNGGFNAGYNQFRPPFFPHRERNYGAQIRPSWQISANNYNYYNYNQGYEDPSQYGYS
jgi:hypothetical protein